MKKYIEQNCETQEKPQSFKTLVPGIIYVVFKQSVNIYHFYVNLNFKSRKLFTISFTSFF